MGDASARVWTRRAPTTRERARDPVAEDTNAAGDASPPRKRERVSAVATAVRRATPLLAGIPLRTPEDPARRAVAAAGASAAGDAMAVVDIGRKVCARCESVERRSVNRRARACVTRGDWPAPRVPSNALRATKTT